MKLGLDIGSPAVKDFGQAIHLGKGIAVESSH